MPTDDKNKTATMNNTTVVPPTTTKKEEIVNEASSVGPKKAAVKSNPPPPPAPRVMKTQIGKRLDAAVKVPQVNRSSDLVPLSQEFTTMRHQLHTLLLNARKYRDAMKELEKSRTQVVTQISTLAAKSPLNKSVGLAINTNSLMSVHQAASKQAARDTGRYQSEIIDYIFEWETLVTTRVDTLRKETTLLNEKLNHYQTKTENLRIKTENNETKGKATPTKLTQKTERNEAKLHNAWNAYEKNASVLCNLLEAITKQGWVDMYPLLKSMIDWDSMRAAMEYDVFSKLHMTTNSLEDDVKEAKKQEKVLPIPTDDQDSTTTGSYVESVGSYEEEAELNVPIMEQLKKIDSAAPLSPKGVTAKMG